MTFPAYPAYKDSGVEWLGEVPAHWEVVRLGALFREVSEEGVEGLPILSVSIHDGVSDKELNDDELDRKVTRSDDVTKYRRVEPGDLVYNMMRAWQGGFGTVAVAGMVSPAYVIARPATSLATVFVEQLLRTSNAVEEMRRLSKGVTDFRLRLYWDEVKGLKIVVPSEAEQAAIAAFLDRETAKIDALVAEQERLIELLAEKRRATVSHAVTKGLDPNAPMKDSGIAWLGEVPAHWEVKQLKWIVMFQRGHDLPSDSREEGDVPIVSSGGISGYHSVPAAQGPAIVTGRYGTIGQFQLVHGPFWPLNTALYSIDLRGAEPRYATYLLRHLSPLFLLNAVKSAVPGVDRNDIHPLPSTCPSPAEQTAIADFLDRVTADLDALTTEAQRAVALLKERRAALISAAVTGKIDVRGLVEEAA